MAYFSDLSPYRYSGHIQPDVVHVGWLGRDHNYPKGEVDSSLVEKMKKMAKHPVELYRGFHICELCELPEELKGKRFSDQWDAWAKHRSSNGEIRVSRDGLTYAAPVLITHYIEDHGYLPPAVFIQALNEEAEQVAAPKGRSAPE